MKKLLGLTLVLILALPVIALAQDPAAPAGSQSSQQPGAAQAGAPSSQTGAQGDTMGKSGNVKGTVSQDGKTIVGDDGKSWTIANPDAVKGHDVELKGSADASTNQIQVSSVKMLKGDKGSMKKDSSQPQ